MTRPGSISARNSLCDQVKRRARVLAAEGRIAKTERQSPARAFKLTPGWETIYVHVRDPDGKPRDREAAERYLAERPYAALLVYKGTARNMHVFEYDPARL